MCRAVFIWAETAAEEGGRVRDHDGRRSTRADRGRLRLDLVEVAASTDLFGDFHPSLLGDDDGHCSVDKLSGLFDVSDVSNDAMVVSTRQRVEEDGDKVSVWVLPSHLILLAGGWAGANQ